MHMADDLQILMSPSAIHNNLDIIKQKLFYLDVIFLSVIIIMPFYVF